MTNLVKCNKEGKCFARLKGYCRILTSTYSDDKDCPFQKEKADVYKGKTYPYDPTYALMAKEVLK